MNITSNLHVTKVHLNELSGWSDEELQSFLSSWQYKSKVKLTSFRLYKAREKDYCAGFNCFVKQGNKCSKLANSGVTAHDWIHQGDELLLCKDD